MKSPLILIFLFFFILSNVKAQNTYRNGVVSSADELASNVGISILKKGGNAIDAAVGVAFALAVVFPQAGNIGGGGFMVLHLKDGTNTSIDFREKAPLAAYRDMFLNENGDVIPNLSLRGHLAAGVPGSVAGLLYALNKYGKLNREDVIEYAIELAEKGFILTEELANVLNDYNDELTVFESTRKIFGKEFYAGELFIQKDLAETLKRIRDFGSDGFYKGETARLIVNEMKKGNGIITYEDLKQYQPVEREVIKGNYRGYEILSMGPPSSGGISLIYLLNILENFNLSKSGHNTAETISIMTEAMRRVYADRSEIMGDMDFVNVPVNVLISKEYAIERMSDFDPMKASESEIISHGNINDFGSTNTTHFSVADGEGNVVSTTTTINGYFGNKVVVDGAGFFLNNEMDDFVSKPGVPNMFGLLGNEANAIEPGKRMLSSMTPTIVLKNGRPFLVTGSPGGGRIITAVMTNIVNIIDFKLSLSDAINSPRFHHQWFPDEIQAEKNSIAQDVRNKLVKKGYKIIDFRDYASIDAILINDDGSMTGYSDRRGYGKAIGF